ncbi:MAG: alpha/beta hydrolase [Nevskia sp.]|nr:alpha/beta hydrolase [Nevskia sp.]
MNLRKLSGSIGVTWTGVRLAAVLLMGLAAATAAANGEAAADSYKMLEVYAAPQRLQTLPDGRRMNIYCLGEGSPTVLLDGGATAFTITWWKVQPALAKITRVCAFDRAGLGYSDPGPLPRDTAHIVADLEALLRAAALKPPYVLVGHSRGAFDMELFADRHPQITAGMALIDPAVPHEDKTMESLAGMAPGSNKAQALHCARLIAAGGIQSGGADYEACINEFPPVLPESLRKAYVAMQLRPSYGAATLSEELSFDEPDSSQLAAAHRDYGSMPLLVLTGGNSMKSRDSTPAQQQILGQWWNQAHDTLAARSGCGVNRLVAGTGHDIQREQPDAVIEAVSEVIAAARSNAGAHSGADKGSTGSRPHPRSPSLLSCGIR